MTAIEAPTAPAPPPATGPDWRRVVGNSVATRAILALVMGLLVLSLARVLSGKPGLTEAGALGGAITAAMPIMLAGLGGLWSERSGVVNIGLEGEMILGTWFAAYFAWHSNSAWMLIVGGMFGGLIGGVLHAIATVGFGVDQIISGVAINILAPGIAKYLSGVFFTSDKSIADGGGQLQSPKVAAFNTLQWHWAHDWLSKLHGHKWFFISDIAGLLDGLATSLNIFTILALALIPLSWFVLWRTSFGLRLRSCGENPTAAETLGVKVYRMKVIAVIVSGAARRPGRRVPRRLHGHLPGGPDLRPRLHRPGCDDLRQLAARRSARRLEPVRLHRRAAVSSRRRPPCTPCCCSWPSCWPLVAAYHLYRRRMVAGDRSTVVIGRARAALVPHHRQHPAEFATYSAADHHAARPGPRLAATANARGGWHSVAARPR